MPIRLLVRGLGQRRSRGCAYGGKSQQFHVKLRHTKFIIAGQEHHVQYSLSRFRAGRAAL
jgi:hypothetical protein